MGALMGGVGLMGGPALGILPPPPTAEASVPPMAGMEHGAMGHGKPDVPGMGQDKERQMQEMMTRMMADPVIMQRMMADTTMRRMMSEMMEQMPPEQREQMQKPQNAPPNAPTGQPHDSMPGMDQSKMPGMPMAHDSTKP